MNTNESTVMVQRTSAAVTGSTSGQNKLRTVIGGQILSGPPWNQRKIRSTHTHTLCL